MDQASAGGGAVLPQRLVFITRPEPQAGQWRDALQAQLAPGAAVHALPLIDIKPVQAPARQQRLQQAWDGLAGYAAVFFVSVPAVQHFFHAVPDAAVRWKQAGVRAWAPGRGTWRALRDADVPASLIDSPPPDAAQFDSETLWPLVAGQMAQARARGLHVLRVRGADLPASLADDAGTDDGAGRDWLGAQVLACGVPVQTVVSYQRQPPQWSGAQLAAVGQWAGQDHAWVWSSSQALAHLQRLLPARNWQQATAIVTHPRIGETALRLGFGHIIHTRPTLEDVARSIQSWL